MFVGGETSFGGFATTTLSSEPVNRYTLQAERFSRYLLGDDVPTWPIEDARNTLELIEALVESGRNGGWVSTAG